MSQNACWYRSSLRSIRTLEPGKESSLIALGSFDLGKAYACCVGNGSGVEIDFRFFDFDVWSPRQSLIGTDVLAFQEDQDCDNSIVVECWNFHKVRMKFKEECSFQVSCMQEPVDLSHKHEMRQVNITFERDTSFQNPTHSETKIHIVPQPWMTAEEAPNTKSTATITDKRREMKGFGISVKNIIELENGKRIYTIINRKLK